MSHPLALSHLSALDVAPVDLAPAAAKAGFHAFGIRMNPAAPGAIEYPLRRGTTEIAALKRVLAECAIGIWDIELIPLTPGIDLDLYRPMFEAGAELGARRLNVSGDDQDLARLADTFARLCAMAADYGLGVDLEFMRWRAVGTLAQARQVIERAGAPNGGILLDMLHIFRAWSTVADVAALPKGLITGAQIADAPLAAPPDDRIIEEARNHRQPPGLGELPLADLVRALGPAVPYSVEVPRPPGSDMPLDRHLTRLFETSQALLAAATASP